MSRLGSHLAHNAVAYLALFVALSGSSYAAVKVGSAQIRNNSVRSVDLRNNDVRSSDIRNGTITGQDVAKGSLLADDFRAGQLPAGAPGQTGAPGPTGPAGPTFGDTKLVGDFGTFACNEDVVAGSLPVTVRQPSRIWASAQGSFRQNHSTVEEFGVWARLRDSAGSVVATTPQIADSRGIGSDADNLNTMTSVGVMHEGESETSSSAPIYVAAPGNYSVDLMIDAQAGDCTTDNPEFGFNEDAALTYVLLGIG